MNPDISTTIAATDIFTAIAATLTTISLLPQTIKTIKSGDTTAISLWMYLLFTTGVAFWMYSGFLYNSWPMIIGNGITLVLSLTILWLKIKNDVLTK